MTPFSQTAILTVSKHSSEMNYAIFGNPEIKLVQKHILFEKKSKTLPFVIRGCPIFSRSFTFMK